MKRVVKLKRISNSNAFVVTNLKRISKLKRYKINLSYKSRFKIIMRYKTKFNLTAFIWQKLELVTNPVSILDRRNATTLKRFSVNTTCKIIHNNECNALEGRKPTIYELFSPNIIANKFSPRKLGH